MTSIDLHALVGTTVLDGIRLVALMRTDETLTLFQARRDADAAACTVRISTALELQETDVPLVQSAFSRVARHCVGIRGIATPLAAGAVMIEGKRRLCVVHRAEPAPTAADRIDAGTRMSLEELKRTLRPIADALGALHDQGLVHGAVASWALHLGFDGASLSAFGLSEVAAVIAGPKAARDVLPMLSRVPEQVGPVPGMPVPASDTYGLALIASELLAGRHFTDETDPGEVARVIDHVFRRPTPRELGAILSAQTDAVFEAALAVQPRARTEDPRRFADQLASPPALAPDSRPALAATEPEPAEPEPVREVPAPAPVVPAPPQPPIYQPPKAFAPPTPSPAVRDSGNTWVISLLISMGALLLIGGAAAGFYVAINGPHTSPTATTPPVIAAPTTPPHKSPPHKTPPRITVPGPTDPEPDAAATENDEPAAGPPDAAIWLPEADAGVLSPSAEDTSALIPIGTRTPLLGEHDALVTIVLFADLRCSHSHKAHALIDRLMRDHGSSLRIAVRMRPIPDNLGSDRAALIGAATSLTAGPSAFWTLFGRVSVDATTGGDDTTLKSQAQEAGAQSAELEKVLASGKAKAVIEDDRAVAGRLMVHATPTWFINGRRINGVPPYAALVGAVEEELTASKAALSAGTPQAKLYASRVEFNVTAGAADHDRP